MMAMSAALALAGCRASAPQPAPPQPWIIAAGNVNNLDVAAPALAGGTPGFRCWQRDARGMWRAGGLGQGEPAATAAWREYLMVFFASGRYGLFGLGGTVIRPSPVPAWTPAAACEDGLAVDAFGWDASGDPIHARYADEQWTWKRIEAAIERDKVRDPCAVRFGGRLFIFWREEAPPLTGPAPDYRVRFAYLDKGRWVGPNPSRLRVASAPHVAADGGTMACLFIKPAGPDEPRRWALATYATTDEDWHETAEVAGEMPAGPAALVRQGPGFWVAVLAAGGPQVATLDVASGKAGEFVALPAGPAPPPSGPDTGSMVLFGLSVLVFLLVLVSLRRARQGAGAPVPAGGAPAVAAAPVVRRAAALAIDYLLAFVAILPVQMRYWPNLPQQVLENPQALWQELVVVHMAFLGIIIVYCAVAEAVWGRTVGKLLLGIEVRDESGARPAAWWQAVVRNALRVVDELPALYLLGLFLILVGPKPQRLGDRLGRTLVVMKPNSGAAADTR